MQLTESEVQAVRMQQPTLKFVMRMLKAWRTFGNHGVQDAPALIGAACEVLVMAAADPDQLRDPLAPGGGGVGSPCAPGGKILRAAKPMQLFVATLRLMHARLRTDNPTPIMAPLYYADTPAWSPAHAPYTPIILHMAGARREGACRVPRAVLRPQAHTPSMRSAWHLCPALHPPPRMHMPRPQTPAPT